MENEEERNYLDLLKNILENGETRNDRTGIGTKSIFGTILRFSLKENTIPLLTSKKMHVRGIIEELLFFIRGDTNTKLLEEKGVNIWRGNTSRKFLDSRNLFHYSEGMIGPMYGAQWRNFGDGKTVGEDQLKNALSLIKTDPESRRIIISAYNPNVSKLCVLDPCHFFMQFYVSGDELSCQFQMRSVDSFLGLGYNLVCYATLTHLMAKASGLKANELIFVGGDTHIYNNHINQVKEQISRKPYPFPKLNINKDIGSIEDMEDLSFENFKLDGYISHPAIKGNMAI